MQRIGKTLQARISYAAPPGGDASDGSKNAVIAGCLQLNSRRVQQVLDEWLWLHR